MAMIMENFKHKCDGCEKHVATCDATNPLFAEDRINPMASIPGDTVLWCDSFVGAKNTEQLLQPDKE